MTTSTEPAEHWRRTAQVAAYRSLVSDASEAQRAMAQAHQELVLQQRRTAEDLAELRGRVSHIKNLLREVG